MATTDELRMDDGQVFRVGQRVQHVKHGYRGTVTKIWVADKGPTGIRICVDPDPEWEWKALTTGATWPIAGKAGARFVECRDGGLSPRFWEEERTKQW